MMWTWIFALLLAAGVPLVSRRSARVAMAAGLTRGAVYLNASLTLWILAALGYLVLRLDGGILADVGVRWTGGAASFLMWTIGLAVAGLIVIAAGFGLRRAGLLPKEEPFLAGLRPVTATDRLLAGLVVSPSAGLCEEFLYRGILLFLLAGPLGPWGGLLAASVLFGLGHIYQGWAGMLRAGLIGLLLGLAPAETGSVLPAMAAHTLIDAAGILWLWPRLERA